MSHNPLTIFQDGIAELLGTTKKTIQNRQAELIRDKGMPRPMATGGNPVWLYTDILAWLEGLAAKAALEPLESAPASVNDEASGEPQKRGPGRPRKLLRGK